MFTLPFPTLIDKSPQWLQRLHAHMSRGEKIIVGLLLGLMIVSAVATVVDFIKNHTYLIPQSGGIYREASVGQPHYLNPILAGANDIDVDITRLVYSSLFRLDSNLTLQNDLTDRFEVSADNKIYTIHLRTDARWHDSEPVTADDVIFTIGSIQTPDYGSPLANAFQGVEMEKVDDYTVRFKLRQPYAPFLSSLTVGIAPQHVWESIPPKNAALAEQMLKPVGSGPFKFAEITTRRKTGEITNFRLVRNDNYYGKHPYLDEVNFMFFPTHQEAVDALRSNTVDGVGFLPLQLIDQVQRRSLALHHLLLPQYFGLFFNQERNPILADAGVRNALAAAIDRTQLVQEALRGQGEPLHLPIPPGVASYNTQLPIPPHNPDVARQNLEEAGWKDDDSDGIREKNGKRLELTLTTTDWPEYVQTAEVIQRQWQTIGVATKIEHLGAGTIQQTIVRPREYEILLFGEILSPEPDPYPFWHSSQVKSPGLNFSLLKNKDIDKLLEDARQTANAEERFKKYHEFQAKILDLKPAIILYRPYYLFATDEHVHGITVNQAGLPADRFNESEQWHVRTRRVWRHDS